jgi:hypothetical protein
MKRDMKKVAGEESVCKQLFLFSGRFSASKIQDLQGDSETKFRDPLGDSESKIGEPWAFAPGAKRLLPFASLAERSRFGDSETKFQDPLGDSESKIEDLLGDSESKIGDPESKIEDLRFGDSEIVWCFPQPSVVQRCRHRMLIQFEQPDDIIHLPHASQEKVS